MIMVIRMRDRFRVRTEVEEDGWRLSKSDVGIILLGQMMASALGLGLPFGGAIGRTHTWTYVHPSTKLVW